MTKYQEVRDALYKARTAAQNLPYWTSELTAPAEVKQRLTALYGEERSSGGKQTENPALVAIMMQDERIENARQKIAEANQAITTASQFLTPIRDEKILCIMRQYFISGWSIYKITTTMNETYGRMAINTIQKLKNKGMTILREWYR